MAVGHIQEKEQATLASSSSGTQMRPPVQNSNSILASSLQATTVGEFSLQQALTPGGEHSFPAVRAPHTFLFRLEECGEPATIAPR